MKLIFPTAIILLMLGASAVSFMCGDSRRGVYWLAAAILNAAVTF